jgi:hypothetical protein
MCDQLLLVILNAAKGLRVVNRTVVILSGTAAAKVFEMNSLAEASVVGMTDWDSKRAHWERITAREALF